MTAAPYPTVQLGSESFPLIPQPLGTITRRLERYAAPIAEAVRTGELDGDAIPSSLDGFIRGGKTRVYDLLLIFYPQMMRGENPPMPFWKFDGWASAKAYETGLEDEDSDGGPTIPQIKTAILAGLKANDLDTIAELRDAIPFDGLKTWARARIVAKLEEDVARDSPSPALSTGS